MGEDQPLMAAGLDSLGSMEFVAVLSQRLHIPLRTTLPFDHPTAVAVADHILSLLAASDSTSSSHPNMLPPVLSAELQRRSTGAPKVRAVGIMEAVSQPLVQPGFGEAAAKLPGWSADDAIGGVPHQRWDMDATGDSVGAMPAARFGAFMAGVELFDGAAFSMSAAEAAAADPQHRLLLQMTCALTWPCESSGSNVHEQQSVTPCHGLAQSQWMCASVVAVFLFRRR